MKFICLLSNLSLFFKTSNLSNYDKNNILAVIYSALSDYEKEKYYSEIQQIQKDNDFKLTLLDFFKIRKKLENE